MLMDSMHDRIRARRDELRLTQKRVGKLVGVSASAVSQWESGVSQPSDEKLDSLAEALDIDREWIEFGPNGRPIRGIKGKYLPVDIGNESLANPVLYQNNAAADGTRNRVQTIEVKPIAVIGDVQAGVLKAAVEWPKSAQFEVKVPIEAPYDRVNTFGLRVVGPSMNQVFPDGTIVVCAKIYDLGPFFEIPSGKYVVVTRKTMTGDIEATIKEFVRDENGVAWLWPRSNHPEFQTPIRAQDLAFSDDNDEVVIWAQVIADYRTRI